MADTCQDFVVVIQPVSVVPGCTNHKNQITSPELGLKLVKLTCLKLFVSLLFDLVVMVSFLLAVSCKNCHVCVFATYCCKKVLRQNIVTL